MFRSDATLLLTTSLIAAIAGGCGSVSDQRPADASASDDAAPGDAAIEDAPTDAPPIDAQPGSPGTEENPAATCAELHTMNMPSGAYWLRGSVAGEPPIQVFCEQTINNGGWAMVYNSVRLANGTTTAFWQFPYASRLSQLGTPFADKNYYNGALYLRGREYMDVIVDLQGKSIVAAVMTATGINSQTMKLTSPALVVGNQQVYLSQFAGGWASRDADHDDAPTDSCAVKYSNVAQHYTNCWSYNLGSDADAPLLDGGVGPHVHNNVLTALGLALQTNGGTYSQVRRIARFTRWP